jgi:hypothetical protein
VDEYFDPRAGANIGVTPQMIERGVTFLHDSGRLRFEANGPDRLLVADPLRVSLRLDVQPDLFGQWCFIREWGRIGGLCVARFAPCRNLARMLAIAAHGGFEIVSAPAMPDNEATDGRSRTARTETPSQSATSAALHEVAGVFFAVDFVFAMNAIINP